MRRFGSLAAAVLVAGCGLAGCGAAAADPDVPGTLVAEPTTTLAVVSSTVPVTVAAISADALKLIGTWRYVAVEPSDDARADNLQQGFLRIETPPGLALSISSFRAIDPNDFVCSDSGGGGELAVDDNTLRLTVAYETPAVECLPTIGVVPIVGSVSACLGQGCPYELVEGRLRLTIGDTVAVLERME